jgi:hypothetical protein
VIQQTITWAEQQKFTDNCSTSLNSSSGKQYAFPMTYWTAYVAIWFLLGTAGQASAALFGGIEFPQGEISFADQVIRYLPLYSGGPAPDYVGLDPAEALGPPDFVSLPPPAVALGRGGLLELRFVDNLLTNSGSSSRDLHIFEIGPDVENTFVAIRPTVATGSLLGSALDANGDGFLEIGKSVWLHFLDRHRRGLPRIRPGSAEIRCRAAHR